MPQNFCAAPHRLCQDPQYARKPFQSQRMSKFSSGKDESSSPRHCALGAGDDLCFQRLCHLLSSITQRGHIIVDGYAQPIGFLHFQIS